MSQKTIKERLTEKINSLPEDQQSLVLDFINTKKNQAEIHEFQNHTIDVSIPTGIRAPSDGFGNLSATAQYAAFHAEALFWIMEDYCNNNWADTGKVNVEKMLHNFGWICSIGIALTDKCSSLVDEMEISYSKEVSNAK